jgi:hypothetical protein
MNAIKYVVAALPEPSLWLQGANALRDLCDANRSALAPHIGAFAELHASLTGVPVRAVFLLGTSMMILNGALKGHREDEGSTICRQCNSSITTGGRDTTCRGAHGLFDMPKTGLTRLSQAIVTPVVDKLVHALQSSVQVSLLGSL